MKKNFRTTIKRDSGLTLRSMDNTKPNKSSINPLDKNLDLSSSSRITKKNIHFWVYLFTLVICTSFAIKTNAQSFLTEDGATSICEGESTTIQVIINASVGPYTVQYSDGSTTYTVNNYNSVGDPEDANYGGAPISVTPTATTEYSLVAVYDTYSTSLPIDATQKVSITVNPLPTNITGSIDISSPVCAGSSFQISATATNGSTYELYNASNTVKIANLPYTTSISSTTDYTIRAISSFGCTSSASYTVTVESTPPTISCPGDQEVNPAPGECTVALADYTGSVTVNDNCSSEANITLSQSPEAGSPLVGHGDSQTVTITATDEAGNSNSCNFTVTLIDTENPSITNLPANITENSDEGDCGAVVNWIEPGVSDNCPGSAIAQTSGLANGSTFPIGTTTVVYTATDAAGNTTLDSFTVEISDNEFPTITHPANMSVNTDTDNCNAVVTFTEPTASDNCAGTTLVQTTGLASGSVFPKGVTTNTYKATDASGNETIKSFTITVTDNQEPDIASCPTDINQDNDLDDCGAVVTWTEPTATDNCDGALAGYSSRSHVPGSRFDVGTTTVTYEFTDVAGNTASCSFDVTISDTQYPEISCPEAIVTNADEGQNYATVTFTAPTGTDNCTGATTVQTAGLASGSQFPAGTTTNTFEVTDASGNKTSCSFTVTVSDGEAPVISNCPGDISQSNDLSECGAAVTWTEPTVTDNATPLQDLTISKSHSSGDFFPVGTTTVYYTATDGNDNVSDTCSFTITITDNEKPTVSGCPESITRTSNAGLCTATVSWTEPTATDNCTAAGSLVRRRSHSPGDTFQSGTTKVWYVFEDVAGNISDTCSFNVIVTDDQKPVISNCPSDITVSAASDTCGTAVSWTEPTASDNCTGNISWTKSAQPGDFFPTGSTTVTYVATDESGNESNICAFTVTVTDNINPVASCKPFTAYIGTSGLATISASDINDASSDNCTDAPDLILSIDKTNFSCSDIGDAAVTLTVKDASGNKSTCIATVTIADTINPTITATSGTVSKTVNTTSEQCYYEINGSEFDPIVTDNCSGAITINYTVSGATDLTGSGSLADAQLNSGANLISWSATDANGNTTTTPLSFTITVADSDAPEISSISNQTRATNTGCTYTTVGSEFDITATDNCGNVTLSYKINDGNIVESSTLDGVQFNTGINRVVWTATDGVNTSTRSFRVTVNDETAPTITAMEDIEQNVDPGKCTSNVTWAAPDANDNCAVVEFTQTSGPLSGSDFSVGTTTITYKATDAAGLYTTESFTITVYDSIAPEIICPEGSTAAAPFERDAEDGVCFYTVDTTEFDPVVTDGCSENLIISNSFDGSSTLAGKQLPAGNDTIIWTATDGINTSTCTIYVRINDTQDPTFNQPTGIDSSYAYQYNTDPGQCYYTVPGIQFDLSNINDNCNTETPTYTITQNGSTVFTGSNSLAGLQLPKTVDYPYSVVWTLVDVNGNTVVSDPFTITVNDNQAPSFTCYGNETRTIADNECTYTVIGDEFDPIDLSDNCDATEDLSISYTIDGVAGAGETLAGTEFVGGTYSIVWKIEDTSGNIDSCTFKITVKDLTLPTISTIGDKTFDAPSDLCHYTGQSADGLDPLVTDNCPSITLVNNQNGGSSLVGFDFPVGITVVIWTATDASGNSTTMQYNVTVNDITAPEYNIETLYTRYTPANSCYYMSTTGEFDPQNISDNCTSEHFNINNDLNNYKSLDYVQFPIGTTELTWSVKDNYGNDQPTTIQVQVIDNVDPVISCPGSDYVRSVDDGKSYYTLGYNEFKPVATDNCSLTSYTNSINGTGTLPATLEAGTYNIVWTAIDASGNQTTCTVNVEIVTDVYPAISCVGDQSKNNDPGQCYYTVSGTEFDATSSSLGATLVNDYNGSSTLAGETFPVGITLVTWTASRELDGHNYQNSCSYYVFVDDNEDPVITPPADITVNTNSQCYATGVTLGTPDTTDNCGVLTYWNNNYTTSFHLGTTTITWGIEDIHGNVSYATQTVTVLDDDAPWFNCPGNLCRQADDGQTYYTVYDHEFDPYGTWDCSGPVTITHDLPGASSTSTLAGEQIPVGSNTITWTITDNAGNSTECIVTIDVYDNNPPPVTCRGNATRSTNPDSCTYKVIGDEFNVSSTQSSPAPVLTYSLSGATSGTGSSLEGVLLNRGTTNVTWTATDGSDVDSCCVFDVFVHDNQDPEITWPNDIVANVGEGACSVTITDLGTPVATDNCSAPQDISYTHYPNTTSFSVGTHHIYYTAYDEAGNDVTHTQTVTVVDTISPVINCLDETYYREYDNKQVYYYTVSGSEFTPSVSENCTLSSYVNNVNGSRYLNGYHLALGNYQILWTATDQSSNTDTCTVNVVVVETFVPEISCPYIYTSYPTTDGCSYVIPDATLNAQFTSDTEIPGRTLTHDIQTSDPNTIPYAPDANTLEGAYLPKGTTTVTWTASQTIGGTEYTNTCSSDITVFDNVDPVITPVATDTVFINPGTCYAALSLDIPPVSDNCTDSLNLTITNNANDTFLLGNNNIVWEVSDESGNTSWYTQKLHVLDNEGPIIANCPDTTLYATATGINCEALVSWPAIIATDACSGVKSVTSTHSPGSWFAIGTTEVTVTATDNYDNVTICTFNVEVTDTLPTIECTGDLTRICNANTCSYKVLGNELDPLDYDDNCSVDSLIWSFTDAETGLLRTGENTLSGVIIPRGDDPGQTVITWRVVDANGNSSECSFTLTLNDEEAPIIVVPGNQVRATDFHKNYYTIQGDEFDDVTATDNCGIVIKLENEYQVDGLDGIQLDLGENQIYWYAEDDHGNRSEEIFTVIVTDEEAPALLSAEANTTDSTESGCIAVVNYTPPTFIDYATDGQSSLTITVSPDWAIPGASFPVGVTEVTYSATDSFGNSLPYSFDVTVIDDLDPILICPDSLTYTREADDGESFYTMAGTDFDPLGYSDNCEASLSNSYNNDSTLAGETFPVGTTTVDWIVEDNSGNTDTCTIDIIVEDHQIPVIQYCPDAFVDQDADRGECSFLVMGADYDPFGFSDNHGLSKLTYQLDTLPEIGTDLNTSLAGEQIPVGTTENPTTTVTWRVYDLSGNASVICQTEFTISDTESPEVSTVTNKVRSTDTGESFYTILEADDWDPIVYENCTLEKITYSIDALDTVGTDTSTTIAGVTLEVGPHEIVWTATDIYGNTGSGSFLVTIIDEEAPDMTCNDLTVYLDNTGAYSLIQQDIDSIASGTSDPGGIASIEVSPSSYNCTDVGVNTVTLTATDNYGNIGTCNATVTVADTVAPVANCKDITLQLDVLGEASLLASQINNNSSDACGIQSVVADITSFDCSNIGANTVTITVTDVNGNVSSCSSTVTIEDNITPSAVCNPITVYLDSAGTYSLSSTDIDNIAAGSTDNCDLIKTVTPDDYSCLTIGENTVTLRVTDADNNFDECTTSVTVADTIAPVVVCQDITVALDASGNATITPEQVDNGSADACNVTLSLDSTTFDCSEIGANTVVLTATDDNGNSSSCSATVTITDEEKPIAVCNDTTLYLDNFGNVSVTAAGIDNGSYDICGNVSLSIDNTAFTCANVGANTVVLTVEDEHNNIETCSSTVTVRDTVSPVASCKDTTIYLDATGNATITAAGIDNNSSDNCAIDNISASVTAFTCADTGVNLVTLTVTDVNGNASSCQSNVTVRDTISPIVACQDINIYLDATGAATITGNDLDNGSTDNCSSLEFSLDKTSFACENVGPNTVTLTATDGSGNTSECTSEVTVIDTVSPEAICQAITIQLDADGDANIVANDINNNSSDACGITSLSASKTAFTCSDLGDNNVTLTVTDNNTNQATCVAVVTVEDNIDPVISCAVSGVQAKTTDTGECTYTHPDNSWDTGVTDNCDGNPTLTYSLSGDASSVLTEPNTTLNGQVFNKGTTTVTWTAIDAEGNESTCTFDVTVTDDENPVASCQNFTAQLQRNGEVVVYPSDIDNNSTDNCGITSYLISKDNSNFSDSLTYSCSDIADLTIYLKVADEAGNENTCSSTISVVDEQAPTLDDLSDRNVFVDTDVCTYAHADDLWNPTDNCDASPTITYTLSGATTSVTSPNTTLNGQVFEKGTTTVTWTVTDHATTPNASTVVFDVVVGDDQAPTISCPGDLVQVVASSGATSKTVTGITAPTYDDNCAVTKLTYSYSGATTLAAQASGINELSEDDFNVGTTTVSYIAYDADDNSDTCSFDITINAQDGAIIASKASITTSEDLDYEDFTVTLGSAPTGTVVIDVSSSEIGEGEITTPSNSKLTFNSGNWSTPQTVRVTGVNDDVDDDDIAYQINLAINKTETDDLSGYENASTAIVSATNLDNDVAGITVSAASNTTEAGGDGTFTVKLNTEPTENVSFTLEIDSGDLTEGEITSSTTLTFTPLNWDQNQTITLSGLDDEIDDGNIVYQINISNASSADPKYNAQFATSVSATNVDDDASGFVVTPVSLTTSEDVTTAQFTVNLTSKPATDTENFTVVVDVESNDLGEGTVDKDSLIFTHTDWSSPQTITVSGVDDGIVDGDITFTILNTINTSSTTDPIYETLNPNDVTVVNEDNDIATLNIDDVTQIETNSGTTNFIFTITQSNIEVVGGYTVGYFTSNSSARAPSDFTARGGSVSFAGTPNETQTITITVNGDEMVEQNEIFTLNLTSATTTGVNQDVNIVTATGFGTITNDDASTISIADATTSEGDSGTKELEFIVTLDMAVEASSPITMDYTVTDDTATDADGDFDTKTGQLSFSGLEGETHSIFVTINGDEKVELDEDFTVTLSNIQCSTLPAAILSQITFADSVATGTITNDDSAILSIADFTATEGTDASKDFVVTLNYPVQGEFTVDFATSDNSAVNGKDYTTTTQVLTFGGANSLSQAVTIPILDGDIAEATETLFGTIDNLTDGLAQNVTLSGGGTSMQATGTILDDDFATLAIDSIEVTEGTEPVIASFTVTLSGNIEDSISFKYQTQDVSAEAASDYTALLDSIVFESGSTNGTTKQIDVSVLNNNIAEATETYRINLFDLDNNAQSGVSISDDVALGTIYDEDTVHLTLNAFTVAETNVAQTQNFYISRDIASQDEVTLIFASQADATPSAVSTADFTAQSGVDVTLTANSTDNINVSATTIAGDIIAEPTETFNGTVSFNNKNGQLVVFTAGGNEATATITDDDEMQLTLHDSTIVEGDIAKTVNYRLSTNIAAEKDVVVSFTTSNGTALDGNDYTAQSGTSVTIPGGSKEVFIPVELLGDEITEPTEQFSGTISFTNINSQQVTMADNSADYTITDNDPAILSIDGFTIDESEVGSVTAQFKIALSKDVQNAFTVDFATADIADEATAGNDYTAVGTTTLNFGASNDTVQYVEVTIVNDSWVEPTETFNGVLSNLQAASQNVTLSNAQASLAATATITDNDTVSIAINDATVAEDTATHLAVFTITITGNIQDELTVDYTTNDGYINDIAEQPSDYTLTAGTLTFTAGSLSGSTQTISVPIIDDEISEPITETYTVDLSNIVCTGASLFTDQIGDGEILDDDPITQIDINGFTVQETDGNVSHNFIASMDIEAQEDIVLSFTTTEGSALHTSDITAQSAIEYTILAGDTSVLIPVEVIGNNITEPQESFTGTIAIIDNNDQNVSIGTATATGTINDDDDAVISIAGFDVNEGDGNGIFTVSSDHVIQDAVTVSFVTSNNSAIAGVSDDYTAIGTTVLDFGNGNDDPYELTVSINDDDWTEATENLFGTLSSLNANSQNITLEGGEITAQDTGFIRDNDQATLSINDVSKTELDDGETVEYEFTVTHSGKSTDGSFTVAYNTNSVNTKVDNDYLSETGTITFSGTSGETQTISITVNGDDVLEPDETFTVDLSEDDFGERNIIFSDDSGLGTITDNDAAAVTIADGIATEGGNISFEVELTADVQGTVEVEISFADVSTSAGDFTATTQTVTFTNGNAATQTITVATNDDAVLETDETFTASIALTSGNTEVDVTDTATGTITDNDAAAVTIADGIATEGGNISFEVELTADVQGTVEVEIRFADVSTSAGDFTATTQTVTFTNGNAATQTITVATNDDAVLETDETFTASIALTSGNTEVDVTDTATGTITDNDAAAVTIADGIATEGGNISFEVELTADVQGTVEVEIRFADVSTSAGDFTATTQTVTFTNGNAATQTITVATNDDAVLETDETFTVPRHRWWLR